MRHLENLITIFSIVVFAACAPKPKQKFDTQSCENISSNQTNTFMAPLVSRPTQIVIDSSFNEGEQLQLEHAVDTWNAFGAGTFSQNFFEVSVGPMPTFAVSGDPRDCESIDGSDHVIPVVEVTSSARWSQLGMNDSIPAATFRCYADDVLTRQVVMIYRPIIPEAQLRTVLLHEIGHAVGLDHSCEDGSKDPGVANCAGLPVDHPFKIAVMSPSIGLSGGNQPELKEDLRANDTDRAQCLYKNL